MSGSRPRRWSLPRILEIYYLFPGTPLFILLDWYLSAPLRVAALADSGLRWPYYALLLACGALCRWKPKWAPAVGMAESSVNLLLLMLGVLLPVWDAPGRLAAGEPLAAPFDEVGVANFLLSGAVFIYVFRRSQSSLLSDRR